MGNCGSRAGKVRVSADTITSDIPRVLTLRLWKVSDTSFCVAHSSLGSVIRGAREMRLWLPRRLQLWDRQTLLGCRRKGVAATGLFFGETISPLTDCRLCFFSCFELYRFSVSRSIFCKPRRCRRCATVHTLGPGIPPPQTGNWSSSPSHHAAPVLPTVPRATLITQTYSD